jgi:hypothetical protein
MSRKHLPAAAPVSIGCSVALNDPPRAFTVRTMSRGSPMLRAKRSMRVTISTSPGRSIQWAAKTPHPDLFKDIDIRAEARNFYLTFFNYSLTEVELDQVFQVGQ